MRNRLAQNKQENNARLFILHVYFQEKVRSEKSCRQKLSSKELLSFTVFKSQKNLSAAAGAGL